jgi:hypothetical protein
MHGLINRVHLLSASGAGIPSLSKGQRIALDPRVGHGSSGGNPYQAAELPEKWLESLREHKASVIAKRRWRLAMAGSWSWVLIVKAS